MRIITTYNQEIYKLSGHRLVKGVEEHLPDAQLEVYEEERVRALPEYAKVLEANKDIILISEGGEAEELSEKNIPMPDGWPFNARWFNWFKKIIVLHDCIKRNKYKGYSILFGADVRILKPFTDELLHKMSDKAVGLMLGNRQIAETDFVAINENHPDVEIFFDALMYFYTSGEFRKHERWDDSYAITFIKNKMPHLVEDLAAGATAKQHTNSNGHTTSAQIIPFTEWGEYIEHDKGSYWRAMKGRDLEKTAPKIQKIPAEEVLHFYVGTDMIPMQRAEVALIHSIRKTASKPSYIEWMDESRDNHDVWKGWNNKRWYTKFSNFRWAIPERRNFKGRAVYLDVDQIILKDPKELFELPIPEGKAWLSIDKTRTDVMLFDCSKFNESFWPSIEEMKKSSDHIGHYIKRIEHLWAPLPEEWCCNDGGIMSNQGNKFQTEEYSEEKTCLLHYTQMNWQPWKPYPEKFDYPKHPHQEVARIWWETYAEALEHELGECQQKKK